MARTNGIPFRYLITEGFWRLVKDGREITGEEVGVPRDLFQLAKRIDGGRFTSDLWHLLQDTTARAALRQQLLITYFPARTEAVFSTDIAVAAQAKRLQEQAAAKFRTRPSIVDDAGRFVRHSLFPVVIRGLYDGACAVCRRDDHVGNQSIVDAAHIMSFGEFQNDDPRNGIALCKNHHWAFDVGAISVGTNYEIIVSKKIVSSIPITTKSASLILPTDSTYAPALNALAWHRERWGLP